MKSMTGFGVGQIKSKSVTVDVSIRAVNGRFFDAKVHLPSEYQQFEKDIRECVTSQVHRGSVSIIVTRKRNVVLGEKSIIINTELARKYVSEMKKLSKSLKIKGEPTLEMLSQISDIVTIEESSSAAATSEKELILKAVSEALSKLEGERVREGESLKGTLQSRVKQLEALRQKIYESREEANLAIKQKLEKRVEDLKLKTFDSHRLSDEVVWLLDKSDIDEELTRLKEHISHFSSLMRSPDSQGKKLDFYTQELLREVNTIGSKANHGKITQSVIEAKNLIEQIKEQVQNIE